jgi:hypothetical protein
MVRTGRTLSRAFVALLCLVAAWAFAPGQAFAGDKSDAVAAVHTAYDGLRPEDGTQGFVVEDMGGHLAKLRNKLGHETLDDSAGPAREELVALTTTVRKLRKKVDEGGSVQPRDVQRVQTRLDSLRDALTAAFPGKTWTPVEVAEQH